MPRATRPHSGAHALDRRLLIRCPGRPVGDARLACLSGSVGQGIIEPWRGRKTWLCAWAREHRRAVVLYPREGARSRDVLDVLTERFAPSFDDARLALDRVGGLVRRLGTRRTSRFPSRIRWRGRPTGSSSACRSMTMFSGHRSRSRASLVAVAQQIVRSIRNREAPSCQPT